MPVYTVKVTGDTAFSNVHSSGGLYTRSTNSSDDGYVVLYGRKTSDSNADHSYLNIATGEGKIEQLSSTGWSNLYLARWNTALNGTGSIFSNNGTPASGSIKITTNPSNGDTIAIGLQGFTQTFTFKSTLSSNNDVLIGTTTAQTADNLASCINDSSTGSSNPVEDYQYKAASPNAYLSATAPDGASQINLTDRINCKRQLAWAITPSDESDFHICEIRGGIDGTKIADISAGDQSASTNLGSGINLDSEDLSTTNVSGYLDIPTDSVATRGRFVVDIKCQDPGSSILSVIQLSNDGTNWKNATSTITDLNTDQDQRISGDDLFSEFARLNFTYFTSTAAKALNIKIITQG